MDRKGDMSINVIIVAVLALIVLVVLIFIFNSKMALFGKGASNCPGTCISEQSFCDNDIKLVKNFPGDENTYSYTESPGFKCPDSFGSKQKCCVRVAQQ